MAKTARKIARKSAPRKAKSSARRKGGASASKKKWSARVTQTSDALNLKHDVFKQDSPKAIARSLKRSAERSTRRKSDPYRSAMTMLVFYINRAGNNLPATRRNKLEAAKGEFTQGIWHGLRMRRRHSKPLKH